MFVILVHFKQNGLASQVYNANAGEVSPGIRVGRKMPNARRGYADGWQDGLTHFHKLLKDNGFLFEPIDKMYDHLNAHYDELVDWDQNNNTDDLSDPPPDPPPFLK